MAFTKITNAGFGLTTGTLVGVAASFSSTVSVGGTLTYEDVTNVDSVGLITARSGISITGGDLTVPDAIIHDGDTNTRIRFPDADTFSVETAGNERLRVSSGGDMGLGTASPTARLDVRRDDADGLIAEFHQSSGYGINIKSSQTVATIQAEANQALTLETGSSATERLRITSDGKMGLGTNSPSQNLHIYQATGDDVGIRIQNNDGFAELEVDSDELNYNADSHVFNNQADSAERMRIDSSGNVKIGTRTGQYSFLTPSSGNLQIDGGILFEPGSGNDAEIFSYRTTALKFGTGGTEKMRIDSSGNLGIGVVPNTHNLGKALEIGAEGNVLWGEGAGNIHLLSNAYYNGGYKYATSAPAGRYNIYQNTHTWARASSGTADAAATFTESMRLDSSGRLLVGKTSGSYKLELGGVANPQLRFDGTTTSGQRGLIFAYNGTNFGSVGQNIQSGELTIRSGESGQTGYYITLDTIATERMRIDPSGRVLINHTSDTSPVGYESKLQMCDTSYQGSSFSMRRDGGNSGPALVFSKSRASSKGGNTIVQNGDIVGEIRWFGADGVDTNTPAAEIKGEIDGTPGNNDMPGRLTFFTTADGALNTTERMRIDSSGKLLVGKTSAGANDNGAELRAGASSDYAGTFSASGHSVVLANRNTNDGVIIRLRGQGNDEGSISVSGSTVSYNGAHLARWSQLPGGAERTEILRGSVLSNLDEMCEWGDENNEQLNRMKVSDVEGDINVAGVFQAWDDDDDTYTNDFYCAMTGDFVIRIASGVTVQRGNLLMSAGDGTAKPQGDGYIQDKTIAKVTSTTVSTTYSDGSYCVPCVLMAC